MTDRSADPAVTLEHASELAALNLDNVAIAKQLSLLEEEIARERQQPFKQLRNYLIFKILTGLSQFSPPIPIKMASRFARSASKRDPSRTLDGREGPDAKSDSPETMSKEIAGGKLRDPQKQNILIVSHEASLTGAPILALNLVQSLSERYNVTVLSLRGGEILESFRSASIAVYTADKIGQFAFGQLIAGICRNCSFVFAVVNTAEARGVLRHLRAERVRTVTLVHEFASYLRQKNWRKTPFEEVFEGSSEVIFSTELTLKAAQEKNPRVNMSRAHIFPQGKCHAPRGAVAISKSNDEKVRLNEALRPSSAVEKRLIVLGAGTVELRKGVDLFIEMATRVLNMPGGENAFFFWIGSRYRPDQNWDYSGYLHDQLRRAGVDKRVIMLSETTEIELAYSLADIFVLSSRLDPLPNVTIDAMSIGLPVICFENASGIANLLADAGLKDVCVAAYIDTHDMADKVLALATNPTLRAEVSARSRDYAAVAFNFDNYARRIEVLGLNAVTL